MKLGMFTIVEWIAVIGFISSIVIGFAKLYSVLSDILKSLELLNDNFNESKEDRKNIHAEIDKLKVRLAKYDERFITIFKKLNERG